MLKDIQANLKEAWGKFNIANIVCCLFVTLILLFFFFLSMFVFVFGLSLFVPNANSESIELLVELEDMIYVLVTIVILAPMFASVYMTGIQIARNGIVSTTNPFIHYSHFLKLALLVSILNIFGCILPTTLTSINPDSIILKLLSGVLIFCFWVLYSFSLPLVIEKQLSLRAALKTSRKMVLSGGFKTPILFLFFYIICFIGMLPLGIGLLWCGPFALISYGILYRDLSKDVTDPKTRVSDPMILPTQG